MEGKLNSKILKKINDKTKDELKQRDFIVSILKEESKGIGWYTKLYMNELDKYTKEGDKCEI